MALPSYCTMCRRGQTSEKKMRESRRYVMGKRAPRSRPASSSDDDTNNNNNNVEDNVSVSSVDTTYLRRLIHSMKDRCSLTTWWTKDQAIWVRRRALLLLFPMIAAAVLVLVGIFSSLDNSSSNNNNNNDHIDVGMWCWGWSLCICCCPCGNCRAPKCGGSSTRSFCSIPFIPQSTHPWLGSNTTPTIVWNAST